MHVTQQQIVEAIQEVPQEHWADVLRVLKGFKAAAPTTATSVRTGTDLAGSDLIGIWADRADIADAHDFARQLRHQASHRQVQGKSDVAGH
jgi:hypothetical protein